MTRQVTTRPPRAPRAARVAAPPPIHTSRDLRRFLLDRMHDVVTGKITVDKAKAVANLSQQVYNTVNVEIKMAQARKSVGPSVLEPVKFE